MKKFNLPFVTPTTQSGFESFVYLQVFVIFFPFFFDIPYIIVSSSVTTTATATLEHTMDRIFPFSSLPPELQLDVFECMDRATLHSTVQVNKRWHNISACMLWSYPSARRVAALTLIQPLERRQYYASKIRVLRIREPKHCSAFNDLVFSSLRDLGLSSDIREPGSRFSIQAGSYSYFQAKLQAISVGHCIMHQNALSQIKSHCASITKIELCHAVRQFDDDVFAEFIQSLPCLRDFTLGNESTTTTIDSLFKITADTLAPLIERLCLPCLAGSVEPEGFRKFMASCKSLKYFCLYNTKKSRHQGLLSGKLLAHVLHVNPLTCLDVDFLTPELIGQTLLYTSAPFARLQRLRLKTNSATIISALRHTSNNLRTLHLFPSDITAEVFTSISRQTNLHALIILLPTFQTITNANLLALSSLKNLRLLAFIAVWRPAQMPNLDDTTFRQWIANFPELQRLEMRCGCPKLTAMALQALADACPLLETCTLMYTRYLSVLNALGASLPVLPNLTNLQIHDVDDFMWIWSAGEYAKMLMRMAPKLDRFGVESDSEGAVALVKALHEERPYKPLGEGDVAGMPVFRTEMGALPFRNY